MAGRCLPLGALVSVLSGAALMQRVRVEELASEVVWSTKPKIFTIWSFMGQACYSHVKGSPHGAKVTLLWPCFTIRCPGVSLCMVPDRCKGLPCARRLCCLVYAVGPPHPRRQNSNWTGHFI